MTKHPLEYTTRGDSLARARAERTEAWFKGRHWRVMTEVTARRVTPEGDEVVYDHGEVWIIGEGTFTTPFGNPGRHGFLVCEVGTDGKDIKPAVCHVFGHASLVRARDNFGAIAEVPGLRRKPPR